MGLRVIRELVRRDGRMRNEEGMKQGCPTSQNNYLIGKDPLLSAAIQPAADFSRLLKSSPRWSCGVAMPSRRATTPSRRVATQSRRVATPSHGNTEHSITQPHSPAKNVGCLWPLTRLIDSSCLPDLGAVPARQPTTPGGHNRS